MDLPGFHIDGGAIVALLALVNTALLVWTNRKVTQTHDAVNGMQAAKIEAAHQQGVDEGKAPA